MIYTHKPIQITAVEYTKFMQEGLIALEKNTQQNPIDVIIPEIGTAKLTWNFHTRKVHLQQENAEKEIKVGDYICKLEEGEKPIHFRLSKKMLEKYYK